MLQLNSEDFENKYDGEVLNLNGAHFAKKTNIR